MHSGPQSSRSPLRIRSSQAHHLALFLIHCRLDTMGSAVEAPTPVLRSPHVFLNENISLTDTAGHCSRRAPSSWPSCCLCTRAFQVVCRRPKNTANASHGLKRNERTTNSESFGISLKAPLKLTNGTDFRTFETLIADVIVERVYDLEEDHLLH